MDYRITGRIRNQAGVACGGYTVQGFDKDLRIPMISHADDRLGKDRTPDDGSFSMIFDAETFKDWIFKNEPQVYLTVRDGEGKVVVQTPDKKNNTAEMDFQIMLGRTKGNPREPDIYANNLDRMIASLRNIGDSIDATREDVAEVSSLILEALTSWTTYRDELQRVVGYDGIQVPKLPRGEDHAHMTRWDEAVLPSQ